MNEVYEQSERPIKYCEACGRPLNDREAEDGCLCDTCREYHGYNNNDF